MFSVGFGFVIAFFVIISSGGDDDTFAKCAVKQLAILQPHVKRQLPTEAKLFLVRVPFLLSIRNFACLSSRYIACIFCCVVAFISGNTTPISPNL